MPEMHKETRPLRPSDAAHVTQALCAALSDLLHQEGAAPSRRTYLIMCGLASAADFFSHEVSHWFGSRTGEDLERLEAIQERCVEGRRKP
ncbi:MAG TPA: hypothetical protein VF275_08920 [Gammaproteobacteria bacterium]